MLLFLLLPISSYMLNSGGVSLQGVESGDVEGYLFCCVWMLFGLTLYRFEISLKISTQYNNKKIKSIPTIL